MQSGVFVLSCIYVDSWAQRTLPPFVTLRELRMQLKDLFPTIQRKLRGLLSKPKLAHYQITANDCMPSQPAYHENYLVVQSITDLKPSLLLSI